MKHPMSCGNGIAARAALPSKLGEVAAAMAALLTAHQPAIDVDDEGGPAELHAYATLVEEYEAIAVLLKATSETMANASSLPAVRHDVTVLTSERNREAFARFVEAERDLRAALDSFISGDDAMLAQMKG